MKKRELVLNVMDGGTGDRVPVGFWWHFTPGKDHVYGYQEGNDIFEKVLAGHKKMIDEFKPDMVKIMSDGFFTHPSIVENNIKTVDDLKNIEHINKDHPWVKKQIDLINNVLKMTNGEVVAIYNIFSAVQQLRLYVEYIIGDLNAYREMMIEHTEETLKALKIVEEDTKMLLNEIKEKTNIDGVYYSVQMLQHPEADEEFHQKWIVPSDLNVLNHINSLWEYNMLHICGYEHYHNNIKFFKQYPCKCYNWATHTDNISMKEGKEIFGTCVCGGFDNNPGTFIETASLDELKDYTKNIIKDAGKEGLIIGADCTIPSNLNVERLNAIRDAGK